MKRLFLDLFLYVLRFLGLRSKQEPRIVVPPRQKPKPEKNPNITIDTSRALPFRGIVWHHSASPDRVTRDWDSIIEYHTSYRIDGHIIADKSEFERRLHEKDGKVFNVPWRDVGYNGATEWVDGKIVFQWGRPLDMIGAHAGVAGISNLYNQRFLGLCCIGNFDSEPPNQEMWEFNQGITCAFMKAFNIQRENVIGHREVYDRLKVPRQKSCPGLKWDMEKFRLSL